MSNTKFLLKEVGVEFRALFIADFTLETSVITVSALTSSGSFSIISILFRGVAPELKYQHP